MTTHTGKPAYPGYTIERAYLYRAVADNLGVMPEVALGLLETTEILAGLVQELRALAAGYKQLADDASGANGVNGAHPHEWEERRARLAREYHRLKIKEEHEEG